MKLKQLSNDFYTTYNYKDYPNILRKKSRSYAIYKIEIDGITIGIPGELLSYEWESFPVKSCDSIPGLGSGELPQSLRYLYIPGMLMLFACPLLLYSWLH